MMEFYIHVTSLVEQTFEADGRDFDGSTYHMSGRCNVNNQHQIEVTFSFQWSAAVDAEYYQGFLDESGVLMGYMGWSEDARVLQFVFKQLPADIMVFYPSPLERERNLAQARWKFAIQSTLQDVKRKMWSWSYFAERRQRRKRYIQLNIAYWYYGREPVGEEFEELVYRRRSLTPADACFYRDIRDRLLEIIPRHE